MASCSNNTSPPDVKKIPKEIKTHDHVRTDNYYWMRLTDEQKSAKKYDSQTQDVINYIDDETEYLNKSLKHTKPLQKTLYNEMVGRIKKDDQSVPYLENGYYYYVRYEDKKEYPIYCRKYKNLDNNEEIILDVNVLAEGHEALELPFEMVEVASGEYMGEQWNPSGWGSFDEDTVKTIDYDFEIMKYEVTNAEYAAFLIEATANGYLDTGTECNSGSENSTPVGFLYPGETFISYWTGETYTLTSDPNQYGWCDYLLKFFDTPNNDWASQIYWNGTTFVVSEGYGNHPVVSISYTGAWAFANYYGLRLPTKDEWLKAARGMNTWDTAYGPETGYDNPSNRANLRDSGDPFDNYGEYRRTTPVGFYNGEENEWGYETIDSPSPYGTYDQTGNVEEWTSTCSSGSPSMFVKGGNWNYFLNDTGSLNNSKATRSATSLGGSANGFRCVRTIVTSDNQETQTNIKTVK